ncbi:hypothetical protein FNH07_29820 [Amycolatopsis bartoniae]|nr:hypothetical protein FNH07_29820 [Amycolatopsis bartoniae]
MARGSRALGGAGEQCGVPDVPRVDRGHFRRVVGTTPATNLSALFHLTKAAAPHSRRRHHGGDREHDRGLDAGARPNGIRANSVARIDEVRAQGWALIDQELERGVRSVAVPLRDDSGQVVAAVTVGTHTSQIDDDTLFGSILPRLRDCAAAIGRTITASAVFRGSLGGATDFAPEQGP